MVVIFYNITVFTVFLIKTNAALMSTRDLFQTLLKILIFD